MKKNRCLKQIARILQESEQRRIKAIAESCVVRARHPRDLGTIAEELIHEGPAIADALLLETLDENMPVVHRKHIFVLVRALGFQISQDTEMKVRRAFSWFEKDQKNLAEWTFGQLKTG
jgi:hypothetical protein